MLLGLLNFLGLPHCVDFVDQGNSFGAACLLPFHVLFVALNLDFVFLIAWSITAMKHHA
jgi:hypothetical protein